MQKENVRMEEVTEKPDQNSLYAKAAVLMDADSGRILYEKTGTRRWRMPVRPKY